MGNLKKVIEAEAKKQKYRGDFPVTLEQAFIQGCNFMAGHLQKEFDELRAKIAGDAFEAGERRGLDQKYCITEKGNIFPDKQQYLSSLTAVPLEAEAEKDEQDDFNMEITELIKYNSILPWNVAGRITDILLSKYIIKRKP